MLVVLAQEGLVASYGVKEVIGCSEASRRG